MDLIGHHLSRTFKHTSQNKRFNIVVWPRNNEVSWETTNNIIKFRESESHHHNN